MSSSLDNLNEKQIEAVKCINGHIRVIAGAGTGKTRVLSHRYAFLVNDVGISPSRISCLTFTVKAAEEMKQRISKLIGKEIVNDYICTIHAFCFKILKREIYRLGFPKNFSILDTIAANEVATQVMYDNHLNWDIIKPSQIVEKVRKYKYDDLTRYIKFHILLSQEIPTIDKNIARFIKIQKRNFRLDFDDIILFTLYILEKYDEAKEYWRNQLDFIMVDEAQDCSIYDWKIINILSSKSKNLFIVGDPDQAIYEWRGAKPELFNLFKYDYNIILNENYRSTPQILSVANSIITHNKNRIPKDLYTNLPKGQIVTHKHFKSEESEAEWIVNEIKKIYKKKTNDIAIIYRNRICKKVLENTLIKEKIKYVIWGETRLLEDKNIRYIMAFLRLIVYPNDEISIKQIKKVQKNSHFYIQIDIPEIVQKSKDVYDTSGTTLSDLLEFVIETSKIKEIIRFKDDEEGFDRLAEFCRFFNDFERSKKFTDLASFLDYLVLLLRDGNKPNSKSIKLMTVHQAKGLEFSYVFIIGLTEGIFPSLRTIRERGKDGEEEERRLMYVGVTRAKKMLYFVESEGYCEEAGGNKYPSRFIWEINDGLVKLDSTMDKEYIENGKNFINNLSKFLETTVFRVGDRVSHRFYGKGVVTNVNYDEVAVLFDNKVNVRLRSSFLEPA